ncbi:MAG: acyl-CoA dehydrogenase family protein [Planctomycetota bacterium]
MNFDWTPEQLQFRDEIQEFSKSLDGDVVDRDKRSEFPNRLWMKCAKAGIQGMAVPKEYGGTGKANIMAGMLAMETMGYCCRDMGLLFALNAQMWTVQLPIKKFGTEAQKEKFLPGMCAGELIGAHAVTEPTTGSDAFSLKTTAKKVDGGYILDGSKRLVTLGPIADLALVFATIDPAKKKWGVTAFLVESQREGYRAGPSEEKMGLRTVPQGSIYFENCFVPDSSLLGTEGGGFSLSQQFLEFERCCILASQIGAMEYQLEESVKFAKTREQFGKPIGKFQSVSNRIADMKLRIETAKLLLYKVAWLKLNDRPAMLESALVKLYLSECFVDSSLDAIRIHGGRGYLSDEGVERSLRDAIGGVLYAGTSDIQRNIVSRLLGL